ncbi:helix-turn-helix domain-containing protein [Paenibacillus radicis (ex Gao et al. 2016)]|uniref:DNA-binding response regulator n=1 Tax=Paenibacillus radicis (ex Gao et al. 2016) TaxID=1737354 RepID=A0A917GXH7_9BACL|nr:helix-turn-helix domain-containing protein [Paenibacillus radicis (ex Gao et al. 2016)]GGG59551.1 hypothetical protein GCM10010918_10910 [Paenibacillus radicis (ex Gao et al. 2016)]
MRVIIADDETWVRTAIKNMLLTLDIPLEIAGEASNGEELIAMTENLQPQLAFIDIHMPKVDGIAAIRAARTVSPRTRWVILSGSADFQYAQEAIRLGVKNYLLKPVDSSSLSACVEEILADYNEDLVKGNEQFEFLTSSYVWGNRNLQDLAELPSYRYAGTLICMDSSLSESLKLQLIQTWLKELHDYMRKAMNHKEIRYARITLRNGEDAIITAWSPPHHDAMAVLRSELNLFIESKMMEYGTEYFALTALQSDICDNLESLVEQFNAMLAAASLRAIMPETRLWLKKELDYYQAKDQTLAEIGKTADRIVRAYQSNDYLVYKKEIDGLERQLLALPPHQLKTGQALITFFNLNMKKVLDADLPAKSWIGKLRELGEKLLPASANKDQAHQDLINQVIRHIEQHYMDDISIHQLATQFHITPNYLSTLFSKRCGVTFSKYITQIRMHKANELLIEHPAMRVQDIAKQLGYYSSSHFIKVFSEFHGSSPSQFREQLLRK